MENRARWSNAIEHACKRGNAEPLADILRETKGEFELVHSAIAELLCPTINLFNYRLKLIKKRGRPRTKHTEQQHLKIALAFAQAKKMTHRKDAVDIVIKKFKITETTLNKIVGPLSERIPMVFGHTRKSSRKT